MSELLPRGFAEQERRHTFSPDDSFPQRVVARISPVAGSPTALWDFVPGTARPIVAVTSLILMIILGVQIFYSEPPEAGFVDAYLESELVSTDQWMYHDADLPQGDDLLLEISLVGSLQ